MRGNPAHHDVIVPKTLAEAINILHTKGSTIRPMAGGTDLMVQFEAGILPPSELLLIKNLVEIQKIEIADSEIHIGAGVTYTQIRDHAHLKENFMMLCSAAALTGAPAIQNQGTLGGNIANASPAADSPPALLAYDAKIEMISSRGIRRIDYGDFHLGYKKTAKAADELIYKIILPRRTGAWIETYKKVGTRSAQAISKTVFSGSIEVLHNNKVGQVRLCFGSVGPTVARAMSTESMLMNTTISHQQIKNAVENLKNDIHPIDDIRSTKAYRLKVSENLLRQFLGKIVI